MGQERSKVEQEHCSNVADYYESVENRLWDHLTDGHIHLGYWDKENTDATLAQGALRLTQVMIDMTAVGPDQRFVDIGCGLGIPGILLAQMKGCCVEGVTISPYQQQEAEKRAVQAGMATQTSFWAADALALPFADASFDGGWFFESIFHMGHIPALREARRILKPGAELLLADVVDIGLMSDEEKQFAKDLCNAEYVSMSEYPDLLESTGFELVDLHEVTREVMGPLDARFRSAIDNMREDLLEMTDSPTLEAFEGVANQLVQTAGYALIRARCRDI